MKKTLGSLLIVAGVILVIISIMALVQAFDMFRIEGTSAPSVGHVLGSIVFPLLLTVSGRWMIRKGREMVRFGSAQRPNGSAQRANSSDQRPNSSDQHPNGSDPT